MTCPLHVYAFKDHFNWALNKGGTEDMVRRSLEASVGCTVFDQGEWCLAELRGKHARPHVLFGPDPSADAKKAGP